MEMLTLHVQKQLLCLIRLLQMTSILNVETFFCLQTEVTWKRATKASSAELLMSSAVAERPHLQAEHS